MRIIVFYSIIFYFFLSPAVIYASDITTGLKSQWSFNEGAGLIASDGSGNGNTATLQSGYGWHLGPISSAIFLDGTGYASAASSSSLSISGNISIAAWVMVYDPNMNAAMRIVSKKITYSDLSGYELTYNPYSGIAAFSGSGSTQAYGTIHVDTAWHHIGCAVSGSSVQIYIDGSPIPMTVSSISPVQAGNTNISIGRIGGGGGNLTGWVDELRIYNRALSASDMSALMANESPQARLIWPFNEGTGTIANDTSGNGNSGTVHSGTRIIDPTKGTYILNSLV